MNALSNVTSLAGAAGAAFVGAMAYITLAPRAQVWGNVIYRGNRDQRPCVALTFDDGPSAPYTSLVLDALREADARATFFVIGGNAQREPDLLRRIDDEAHVIGNHTFDHPHWGALRGVRYWREQIQRTDEVIERITGRRPGMFRPPMGIRTCHTLAAARECGHVTVNWSLKARDGVHTTVTSILDRLLDATAGDVLLLHDGLEPRRSDANRSATIDAIGPLVSGLRQRGLKLVTLDELLGVAAYQPHHEPSLQESAA